MMLKTILNMLRMERIAIAPWAVAGRLLEQFLGRLHARLLGWHGSYIGYGARVIGSRAISVRGRAYINRDCWMEAVHYFRGQRFSPRISIGRGFSVSDRLHLSCVERIEIGDDCLLGSGVYISDHNHGDYSGPVQSSPDIAPVDRELVFAGTVEIGSRVWIGDNVVIIGPASIGDGAVIGAHSIVKGDVPPNSLVVGAPAVVRKRFNVLTSRWESVGTTPSLADSG
jgi:acetyltransferase-like isoleucine patch superfamily enzyme